MQVIRDRDLLESYNEDALGYRGNPEGLFRPSLAKEVVEIVSWAFKEGKCLTPTALRSSTTGSCVAERGFLISSERMDKIVDIDEKSKIAIVEPGVNLGELKNILKEEGIFFPPDPTSEQECTVGGCVATNASGARTLKYGPFRNWVLGIEVVLPDGEKIFLDRKVSEKNCAGFFGFQNPIDFFIGSEGTLGFITLIELKGIGFPHQFNAMFIPFKDEKDALNFCVKIREEKVDVRCLEYFDKECISLLKKGRDDFNMGEYFVVFLEYEFTEEDDKLEFWLDFLEKNGALVDDIMFADSDRKKDELKDFRHFIPSTLNEISGKFVKFGGGKISTDWAVFYEKLPESIDFFRKLCRDNGLNDVYCFGHVGNGHPHFNIITKDENEKKVALNVVDLICDYVCKLGGTITAEHGIGKVKKRYLKFYYDPLSFSWMVNFKKFLDPQLIFSPGNIFDFD